ncbi:MAG: putative demethylmenaquinone methyltransferase, partial [Methanobacteriaceae archaeon 41_258]
YVFGDESGVVIVPQELLDIVMEEAFRIKEREADISRLIEDGIPLSRILGLK